MLKTAGEEKTYRRLYVRICEKGVKDSNPSKTKSNDVQDKAHWAALVGPKYRYEPITDSHVDCAHRCSSHIIYRALRLRTNVRVQFVQAKPG